MHSNEIERASPSSFPSLRSFLETALVFPSDYLSSCLTRALVSSFDPERAASSPRNAHLFSLIAVHDAKI